MRTTLAGCTINPKNMALWHGIVNWLRDDPLQFARSEKLLDFYRRSDFRRDQKTNVDCRYICNQFVLPKQETAEQS